MPGAKSSKIYPPSYWDNIDHELRVPPNLSRKNRALWRKWDASEYQCTGTTKTGEPCTNGSKMDWEHRDEFWPGVTDRCRYHIDEVARRTRDLARIAARSGADPLESLQPSERRKKIRPARKPTRPSVKRSPTPPIDHTPVAKDATSDDVDDDPVKTRAMLKAGWQSWLPPTFDPQPSTFAGEESTP